MAGLVLADAQVVLHVGHAGQRFREVLGAALLVAAADRPRQGDLPVLHGDLDLRGVDDGVVHETFVDLLADALVGAPVVLRPAAPVLGASDLAPAAGRVVAEAGVARSDAVIAPVVRPQQVALALAVVVAPVEGVVAAVSEAPRTARAVG